VRTPIDWVKGDAMNEADVIAAARGCRLIVHAANPPAYHDWPGTVRQMLANTIAAARAEGARIVYPGSVYNFAPDAGPAIAEDAPQAPVTRKGAIRVEMEQMLRQASRQGAKVLVVRAGDFFGPAAPNSALSWMTVSGGGRLRAVFQPGPARVAHAFAYLPDLGETVGRLVDREEALGDYEVFHFAGHWLAGDGLAAGLRRAAGRPRLPILPFPWPLVLALSPFVELMRELYEMRYLWRRPIGLSNARLVSLIGPEPHTPLDTALRATLESLLPLREKVSAKLTDEGSHGGHRVVARA
jgi:nucleoside-diphosphate-sugar epimerase